MRVRGSPAERKGTLGRYDPANQKRGKYGASSRGGQARIDLNLRRVKPGNQLITEFYGLFLPASNDLVHPGTRAIAPRQTGQTAMRPVRRRFRFGGAGRVLKSTVDPIMSNQDW